MLRLPPRSPRTGHTLSLHAALPILGLELLRRHEPVERMMLRRRLEVLADGEEIDIGAAQVVHDLHDLLPALAQPDHRSEEHTSELQSLMRISYTVFCLKKKKN